MRRRKTEHGADGEAERRSGRERSAGSIDAIDALGAIDAGWLLSHRLWRFPIPYTHTTHTPRGATKGLELVGVKKDNMDTATALAGEAFDRLGDAAERKAQAAIIGKARWDPL